MAAAQLTRREWLQRSAAAGAWGALMRHAPAFAWADARASAAPARATQGGVAGGRIVDLVINALDVPINGRVAHALAVNGTLPGPAVRFREREIAVLRVTNRLQEISSIH